MTQTSKPLPKTQVAALAELKRIEATDEPAVRSGHVRKGLNVQAVHALVDKGYARILRIEGAGNFVVTTDKVPPA